MRIRIIGLLAGIAALMLLVATGPAASADAIYHTQKIPFMPVAGGTGGGFVVNIHANGPNVFAHEEYVVQGAQPLTAYEVTLQVSLANDPTCSAPIAALVTATVTTNPEGNGTAFHVFTPADISAAGLHGMTIHPLWTLSTGGKVVYRTECATAQLD